MPTLRARFALPVIALAVATTPLAHGATPDPLKGGYAFDADRDPTKIRCALVTGKLLATLRSKVFSCGTAWGTNSASGKAFISCERKGAQSDYMVFKTRADCEDERQTQAANGD